MTSNITIKKIGPEDAEEYFNFVNKFPYSMKEISFNRNEKNISTFLSAENKYIVGAFNEKKLIGTISGIFPKNPKPYWFGKYLFVDTTEVGNGLGNYDDSLKLILEMFNPIIQHAEKNEIYSFYTRKNLNHQLSYEKLVNRFKNKLATDEISKYRMLQYDIFYERVFLKNKDYDFKKIPWADIYYPDAVNFSDTSTIIILHTLNLTERKKLLGLV